MDGYSHDGFKHLLAMKNIAEHCLMKKKKIGEGVLRGRVVVVAVAGPGSDLPKCHPRVVPQGIYKKRPNEE